MTKPIPTPALTPKTVLYTGTLTSTAHAAWSPVEGGRMVPVLCLTMQLPSGAVVNVQQSFGGRDFEQCRAAAAQLRRGTTVNVAARTDHIQIHASQVEHVYRASAPATQQAIAA